MRTAIFSDVHANLEALEAVLADSACDRFVVLGDIIGYNADPQAVVDRLTASGARCLAGNHDLALTGRFNVEWFNDVAAEAIRWTAGHLDEDAVSLLRSLEPIDRAGGRVYVHGSVRDPAAEYLRDAAAAADSFAAEEFSVGFYGHTHVPAAFVQHGSEPARSIAVHEGTVIELQPGVRYLLNPGSVGQPRDGDARASYLVVENERVEWRRAAYDVQTTGRKIRRAGLPDVLADRLEVGR